MSANEQLSTEDDTAEQKADSSSARATAGESPALATAEAVSTALGDANEALQELDPMQVWGTDTDPKVSDDGYNPAERRTSIRKGVRLNKLISAGLVDDDGQVHHIYLHLVDISDGGMRVNGDIELFDEKPFRLNLQTEPFGPEVASEFPEMAITCRVVWQKRLLGGMFVSGLQFVDKSPQVEAALERILELCSPEGRRLRFRLNRVLGVGIGLDDQTRWLYPLALDLSVEGMRVRLDEPLKVGETFPLQIFLEFDLPTVQMSAEVVWKEEIGPSRFQVGLKFHDLSEDNAKAIQSYIDRCLAKELK